MAAEAMGLTASEVTGLTASEAADRLAEHGPNVLPVAPRPSWVRLLGAELVHFFALMLWVAGGLAFVGGMPQLGVAIFVVIVVNGVFAFAQQQRAEHAAAQLGRLLPTAVTVRRDGTEQVVEARFVVPGDVVVLRPGDRVPADLTLAEASGAHVDESMLTGESVTRAVGPGDSVFGGTFLTGGEAAGLVTATAAGTRLAGIAELTSEVRRPKSPLARELERVVRMVALVAVGVGVGFFGLSLVIGTSTREAFLFAVGVTVALVPEGLLPTVTLSLAIGAQRMASDRALVRHLESVETLGSTTFICTDKTGTLTRNEMNVVRVWTPFGEAAVTGAGYDPDGVVGPVPVEPADPTSPRASAGMTAAACEPPALGPSDPVRSAVVRAARAARLCAEGRIVHGDGGWRAAGDPMEAAIDALARRCGLGDGNNGEAGCVGDPTVIARYPFDPVRRRTSVVAGGQLLVMGAPEGVLPRCTGSGPPGDDGPDAPVDAAERALHRLATSGLRVLAVAGRALDPAPGPGSPDLDGDPSVVADRVERDLELYGLLAFEDPTRPEVPAALAACRRAGIRVAMLTGDHPATARAVAERIGLLVDGAVVHKGASLPDDLGQLGELLDQDGVVISRVAPEDKLRITRALQARGHVVAMTGDGVNDGPALREADIGVAMGRSGTDVARDAADLVLLDDNFATIVRAVEAGRSTFTNIRRFLTYHLSDNVAELAPFVVWALSGGRFPLALGVLQVLCLDIGTDLLPALALGAEAPARGTLDGPPPRRHLVDGPVLRRAFGVLGATEALVELAVFTALLLLAGWRFGDPAPTGATLAEASGAAFTAVVIGQAANAFACRSAGYAFGRRPGPPNRLLRLAVLAELGLLALFLVPDPVADQLGHAVPSPAGLGLALLAAPAVLVADAVHKRVRGRRRLGPGPAGPASGAA